MFFFFMQIFLCFSWFFYRLFSMNYEKQYSHTNFWQSDIWKGILLSSWQALRVEIFIHKNVQVFLEFRSIWLGQIGAFSLGVDTSLADDAFFREWWDIARQYGALFWQVEFSDNNHTFSTITKPAYKKFLEPYTRVLDLTLSEDAILAQMHEKWRYNIRLSERRSVTVAWVEPTSENIDIWMSLLTDTTERDGFAHNSRQYYESFLSAWDEIKLAFASLGWRVIAAGIFVYHEDEAVYYYWASSSDAEMRKHMAPYLLQWFAILEGKKRGCTSYDFLGIAKPWEHDIRLAWVTAFKEKFWWHIKELGQKVLIPLSWKYTLISFLRTIKNRR